MDEKYNNYRINALNLIGFYSLTTVIPVNEDKTIKTQSRYLTGRESGSFRTAGLFLSLHGGGS